MDVNISIISERPVNRAQKRDLHPSDISDKRPDLVIRELYDTEPDIVLKNKDLILDNKYWSLYSNNGYKIFTLKPSKQNSKIIGIFDSEITKGEIYLSTKKDDWLESRLGKIILLNLLSLKKRLVLHACGVIDKNMGYLFLGKSGAGKTTIAMLWSRKSGMVIHDDQIVVCKDNSNFLMTGMPWDTQFENCKPTKIIPLKKIFFISHGTENALHRKSRLDAFNSLVKTIAFPGWDKKALSKTLCLCSDLVNTISCYDLAFLPDYDCIDLIRKEVI